MILFQHVILYGRDDRPFLNMSAKLKKGANRFTLGKVSPETLVNSILGQLDMTDAPESVKPEMNRVIARLREDLTDYFNILKAVKEQIR